MNWHTFTAIYLLAALLVIDPSFRRQAPPGGYRNFVEARGPEPLTGKRERWVGVLLSSLGAMRTALGAGTYVAGLPQNCSKIVASKDRDSDASICSSTRSYGIVGMALGGTMLISGLVYLAISWRKDHQHRKWQLHGQAPMGISF